MDYIEKIIASWEIKYGQIAFTGNDYLHACEIFSQNISKTFDIDTSLGYFSNRHFKNYNHKKVLRLACNPFFSKLQQGDQIYLHSVNDKKINICFNKPSENQLFPDFRGNTTPYKYEDLTQLLVHYCNENVKLREQNKELERYKERVNKYEKLDYFFEDEKFMEDWLERNIHKVIPNLIVIERQPLFLWSNTNTKIKPDLFCMDKSTRELVIVENKVRGRHQRIDTQYLSYRTWAKKNLITINEKYHDYGLRATENLKFVIITDTSDEKLEAICEEHNIALILIDGGVVFEELVPY
jgi:hypothetical protein